MLYSLIRPGDVTMTRYEVNLRSMRRLTCRKRLMSSLEKFAKFAQPDKLLMVGEVDTALGLKLIFY